MISAPLHRISLTVGRSMDQQKPTISDYQIMAKGQLSAEGRQRTATGGKTRLSTAGKNIMGTPQTTKAKAAPMLSGASEKEPVLPKANHIEKEDDYGQI